MKQVISRLYITSVIATLTLLSFVNVAKAQTLSFADAVAQNTGQPTGIRGEGVPPSYDWSSSGWPLRSNFAAPIGFTAITGYGHVYPQAGMPNVICKIHVKDMKTYVHFSGGGWLQVQDQSTNTITAGKFCADLRCGTSTPVTRSADGSAVMTSQPNGYMTHFWPTQRGIYPPNVVNGAFTVYLMKVDRSDCHQVAQNGLDYWRDGSIPYVEPVGTNNPALSLSNWVKLGTEYKYFYGTNFTREQLLADLPPPLRGAIAGPSPSPAPAPAPQPTPIPQPAPVVAGFVKAINFNGAQLTIDGKVFQAEASAGVSLSGNSRFNNAGALGPITDASRLTMLRSSVWNSSGNMNVGVPISNGNYQVYLYTSEDNTPMNFQLYFEGQAQGGTQSTGAASSWRKIGPYNVSVSDGRLDLRVTGGHFLLNGMEIYGQSAPTPSTPSTPSAPSTFVATILTRDMQLTANTGHALDSSYSAMLLYANGRVSDIVNIPVTAQYNVAVEAYSNHVQGVYAQMRVRVDETVVGTFTVTGTAQIYSVPVTISSGAHTISVEFTNNASVVVNGVRQDRDLIVRKMMVSR